MSGFPLKPTHAAVKAYYAALAQFQLHGHTTEEYPFKGTNKQPLRADGVPVESPPSPRPPSV